ncbi:MAG: efflux RND transporter periplasmic adaptor subunit [Hyphomicrobiales bacterium]|nr:efflux RND transporter periplasmic adaptor subunit [Hyphomicrobiales bacterium]
MSVEGSIEAPRGSGGFKGALFVAAVGAVLLAGYGVFARRADERRLAQWTIARATPNVALVAPETSTAPRILTLPGNLAALYDASINAQVSGYVKEWRKDIGANVKKGEVLAVIDTPELDERISQARQEVAKADAAKSLAVVTAQRWRALGSSAAVSRQAVDEKTSDARVKNADVGAAKANLDRLLAQKAFANLTAPFDGVITERNIDIGSYVSPTSAHPLYKVADVHALFIYTNAPQNYAAQITKGMRATFTLPQFPGRTFEATVSATSNAISKSSNALLVQLETANKDGLLQPGSFADVRFELPTSGALLRIPASALVFDKNNVSVATVSDGNAVRIKPVTIAVDLGDDVEIASGLTKSDRIIDNPPDTLAENDVVNVVKEAALRQAGQAAK